MKSLWLEVVSSKVPINLKPILSLIDCWPLILKEVFSSRFSIIESNCQVESIRNGRLEVKVHHPGAIQLVSLYESRLKTEICKKCPELKVNSIWARLVKTPPLVSIIPICDILLKDELTIDEQVENEKICSEILALISQ